MPSQDLTLTQLRDNFLGLGSFVRHIEFSVFLTITADQFIGGGSYLLPRMLPLQSLMQTAG